MMADIHHLAHESYKGRELGTPELDEPRHRQAVPANRLVAGQ